ncbi:MAG: hypothetical protein ABTD50_11045 [Polyangiaceae bacterium]|jgi:hypothetical protein
MNAPFCLIAVVCALGLAAACSHPKTRPYERGDALRYMPTACSVARVYADVAGWSLSFPSGSLTSSTSHSGRLKHVLEAFESSGIHVGQDLWELAICIDALPQDADDLSSAVAVIGGRLGGASALKKYEAVIRALTNAKPGEIVESRRSGYPYLVGIHQKDRVWIAMPAPDVLLFSTGPVTQLDTLKRADDPDLGAWRAKLGTLAGFEYVSPERATGGLVAHGTVSTRGSDLEMDVDARFGSLVGLDATKLGVIRSGLSSLLQASALSPLAGPVQRTDLEVSDGTLRVAFRVSPAELEDTVTRVRAEPHALADLIARATSAASTR